LLVGRGVTTQVPLTTPLATTLTKEIQEFKAKRNLSFSTLSNIEEFL
jgi:hypothetical protein